MVKKIITSSLTSVKLKFLLRNSYRLAIIIFSILAIIGLETTLLNTHTVLETIQGGLKLFINFLKGVGGDLKLLLDEVTPDKKDVMNTKKLIKIYCKIFIVYLVYPAIEYVNNIIQILQPAINYVRDIIEVLEGIFMVYVIDSVINIGKTLQPTVDSVMNILKTLPGIFIEH